MFNSQPKKKKSTCSQPEAPMYETKNKSFNCPLTSFFSSFNPRLPSENVSQNGHFFPALCRVSSNLYPKSKDPWRCGAPLDTQSRASLYSQWLWLIKNGDFIHPKWGSFSIHGGIMVLKNGRIFWGINHPKWAFFTIKNNDIYYGRELPGNHTFWLAIIHNHIREIPGS